VAEQGVFSFFEILASFHVKLYIDNFFLCCYCYFHIIWE